jgi:hypothetical protein
MVVLLKKRFIWFGGIGAVFGVDIASVAAAMNN